MTLISSKIKLKKICSLQNVLRSMFCNAFYQQPDTKRGVEEERSLCSTFMLSQNLLMRISFFDLFAGLSFRREASIYNLYFIYTLNNILYFKDNYTCTIVLIVHTCR